jgi:hypothetical protein
VAGGVAREGARAPSLAPATDPEPRGGARVLRVLRAEWSLACAFLVGLVLRVVHLRAQILADDEWHALVKSGEDGLAGVISSFGGSDHSIPVAAWFEVLATTIGLTDVAIRAPFLLAGLATILVLPLLLRRAAGRLEGDIFAWCLALAPILVFFARFARPYAVTCLAACVALWALHVWARDGRARHALAYVGCAVLASWLLLASLPFVGAPLAWLAWRRIRGRAGPRLGALVGLGAAVGGTVLLLLVPALVRDHASLSSRVGMGELDWGMHLEALRILLGTESGWTALALGALAALGLRRQLRDAPAWTAIALTAVLAQWLVTAWVLPIRAMTFARYALPVQPLLLWWLACGLAAVLGGVARTRAAGLLAPALAVGLYLAGPLPLLWRWPDNWFATRLLIELGSTLERHRILVREVPAFYRELAALPPGSVTLIEAPVPIPLVSNPMHHYQGIHRQWMRLGLTSGKDWRPPYEQLAYGAGYRSPNVVYLEDVRRGAGQGDYLVLHKDLRVEAFARESIVLGPWEAHFRALLGAPVYEDALLLVFDLRAERR